MIISALGDVHLFKADCEKGEEELAKEYNVRGYPTWVLMNADQETIARWMGYSKEHFLEILSTEMADLSTVEEKKARYADLPTVKDALALARYSNASGEYGSAVEYLKTAQELDPDGEYAYDILDNTISGAVYTEEFTYEDAVRAAEQVFSGDNLSDQVYAASQMARLAKRNERMDEFKKYLERGMAAASRAKRDDLESYMTSFKIDYNLHFTGEKMEAVELKKSTYDEGWQDDPDALNSFAWWCYQNDVNLEEALKLAIKAVNLSEPGRTKAMILDTAAHLSKSMGNMEDAVKFMEMAVNEDPDDESWQETLESFKAELNQ